MGLLERALQYKQRLNDDGRETLIDTIEGPADTEFVIKTDASLLDNPPDYEANIPEIISENNDDIYIDDPDTDEAESLSDNKASDIIDNEELISNDDLIDEVEKVDSEVEGDIISAFDDLAESDNNETYTESKESNIEIDSGVHEEIPSDETPDNDLPLLPEMPYFDDYMVLFEIQKEFYQNESVEDVFGTLLFSVMGQLGVSSASILYPSADDISKLVIADSIGLKISEDSLFWDVNEGILAGMIISRDIVDVDDFKDNAVLREEYYRFISINTKLLIPMFKDDELIGAVSIGEKINGEVFNETELGFLNSLSKIAVNVITFVEKFEKAESERLALRIESEILSDVEFFQNSLLNVSNPELLRDMIRKNFYSLGLESYAIFIKNEGEGYCPTFHEVEDLLQFSDSGFIIKDDNRLISFLIKKNASIIIDNFIDSAVISETFGLKRLEKMEQFIAYPFIIAGELTGFIAIFKINPAVELPDVDIRIRKISKFLFVYTNRIYQLDPERNLYRDLTHDIYKRVEREIRNADDLEMPLTLLLFSVKNYKRFYDRFGQIETGLLFSKIEKIIKSRLSSGDFSAKIDRHKFIVVFPGKDRKFAASFSSIVKNEIGNHYGSNDFKLLISFIAAEYPGDGNDLYSLLDVLD